MLWIIAIKKSKRTIVDGVANNAHIIGVHYAMIKTHGLPLGDHFGGFQYTVFEH